VLLALIMNTVDEKHNLSRYSDGTLFFLMLSVALPLDLEEKHRSEQ
jgi:hypothetical protein